jgi:hypothetical protein
MKNEVKNTITRSKPHIRPEDEEKTKEERNYEKDRFESLKVNRKVMQMYVIRVW